MIIPNFKPMRITFTRAISPLLLGVILASSGANAQTDLYIASGTSMYVSPNSIVHTDGGVKGTGEMVLAATADGYGQLSQSGSTANTATVQVGKYLANTNAGWRSFGFPFTGDMSDLNFNSSLTFVNETNDGGVAARHNFFTWNATDAGGGSASGWEAISSTGALPSAAFIYSENNGYHDFLQSVKVSGVPTNGDQSYNLLYTLDPAYVSGTQSDATGWNYIPNPYTCNISISALFGESGFPTYQAVHVYDNANSQYVAVIPSGVAIDYGTAGGSNTTTTHIAPMEGFWVKTETGGSTLTISNDVRDPEGTATSFMKTEYDLFRLNLVSADGTRDQMVVYFDQTTTSSFDNGKEALKKYSTAPVPAISAVDGVREISITALPTGSYSLPLNVTVPQENSVYSFELNDEALDPWSSVELVDLQTGNVYDLRANSSVPLLLVTKENANRFVLNLNKSGVGVEETNAIDQIIAWSASDKSIHIKFTDESSTGWVNVFSVNGQLTARLYHDGGSELTLTQHFVPGVYTVRFEGETRTVTEKLIVQ